MLTTCTTCGTRFRLSAEQLRQAQGRVRCGRCGEVFDAFAHLQGDDGTPWSAPGPADESETKTTQPLPRDDQAIEPGLEAGEPDRLGDTDDLLLASAERKEPRIDDLFAELDTGAESVEPPLEFEPAPETDESLTEELVALETESNTTERLPDDSELPPHDHFAERTRGRRHRMLWTTGVVVLALILLGQWVNANRDSLSRNLVIGPSLSAIYSLIGHPLAAPHAVDAWQITNTNVTSDPEAPGALSITGSLANTAGFAQRWPLLRVELTDRYGDALRARDFTPAQYLPADQAGTLPAPGSAAHFRIDVVDPGPDAVGFEVTACLDLPVGRVCASNNEHD